MRRVTHCCVHKVVCFICLPSFERRNNDACRVSSMCIFTLSLANHDRSRPKILSANISRHLFFRIKVIGIGIIIFTVLLRYLINNFFNNARIVINNILNDAQIIQTYLSLRIEVFTDLNRIFVFIITLKSSQ